MRVPLLVRAVKEDVFKFIYTPSGFYTIINICFFTSLKYTITQGRIPPYFYLRFLFFFAMKIQFKKVKTLKYCFLLKENSNYIKSKNHLFFLFKLIGIVFRA